MRDKQEENSLERRVKLGAVGDIAPGDFSIEGHGIGAVTKKYGASFLFDEIWERMAGYDLLSNLPRNPSLIRPVWRKFLNFLYLMALRVKGKKVRW